MLSMGKSTIKSHSKYIYIYMYHIYIYIYNILNMGLMILFINIILCLDNINYIYYDQRPLTL